MKINRSILLPFFALLLGLLLVGCHSINTVQYYQQTIPWKPNYDEQRMPPVVLPDALKCLNGKKVRTADEWLRYRRSELLRLFEKTMYGKRRPILRNFSIKPIP